MELRTAGVLRFCTGETVEPYDSCPLCGEFHDVRADRNGRYDLMCGRDLAVETTLVTSSVAEQNRRSWEPYLQERPKSELSLGWHVVFESTAKATYGGRKEGPRFKDALTVISPALAELERRGVTNFGPGTACIEQPVHEKGCPYRILGAAGVSFGCSVPSEAGTGFISAGLLTGYDQMPAFNPDHWAKRAEKNLRQEKPAPPSPVPKPPQMGLVQWSFDPGLIAVLEERRDEDERKWAEVTRALFPGRRTAAELNELARREVSGRIALARSLAWQTSLPAKPPPIGDADGSTELVELLNVEFGLHEDLASKLNAASDRPRREVFFWLTWMRSSAWCRLADPGLLPQRPPNVPTGITGVWVGSLLDDAHVLHWDRDTGWTRHPLPNPLLVPEFPGCS
ncbi:hypothetical protein HEP86_34945 [Streptomyces sp. RPA4-5]|uniref:hypothetical protein n=1 Tax=unclassified Streptomyces TaxID=2593676 RepID=UPI00143EC8E9|nr:MULTISPECIES: hypothetical protein [unclassified Streptomyces]QIY58730.1 hypothetical protein HEP86_34945 [Streptomyces sp. RPA4-5]WJY41997.1 hypothetical protein QT196_34730 [Streptomyces sp. P9-2B-2]